MEYQKMLEDTKEWVAQNTATNAGEAKGKELWSDISQRDDEAAEKKRAKKMRQKERKRGVKAASSGSNSSNSAASALVHDDETMANSPAATAKVTPDPGLSAAGGTGTIVEASQAAVAKATSDPGLSAAEGAAGTVTPWSTFPGASTIIQAAPAAMVLAGDRPGHALHCANASVCGARDLMWTEFLLSDPEASWQGQIWGHCQPCSALSPTEFKKQSRRMKAGLSVTHLNAWLDIIKMLT